MATPATPTRAPALRQDDFVWGEFLGKGAFGRVMAAKRKDNGQDVAIKILDKAQIQKLDKMKYVKMERDVFTKLNHPNIIKLICTFQDQNALYFALELAAGGELYTKLKELGTFDLKSAQFFMAELVSALQHIHANNIVHRDLKPDNILLTPDNHLKITDFGTALLLDIAPAPTELKGAESEGEGDKERRTSFVGTAHYVSPEVLQNQPATPSCDLWAVGCILFEFFASSPPFNANTEYLIFQKIQALQYEFPPLFPPIARELVQRLLVLDATARLGAAEAGGYEPLTSHAYFAGVDWEGLHLQEAPTPTYLYPPVTPLQESLSKLQLKDDELDQAIRPLLQEGERVVKVGTIRKSKGIFSVKTRKLVLTTGPRLFYIDPSDSTMKGTIPWSDRLSTELKSAKHFLVHVPGRSYRLEAVADTAESWVTSLKAVQQAVQSSGDGSKSK